MRLGRWSICLWMGTGVLGCRAWPPQTESVLPDVEVDLQVRLLSSTGITRPIRPCQTLSLSESVELVTRSRTSAYVYVFSRDQTGTKLLHPPASQPHQFLVSGQQLRLPTELSNHYEWEQSGPGVQQLLAFASLRPLDASRCVALDLPCPWVQKPGRPTGTRGEDSGSAESRNDPPPSKPPQPHDGNRPGNLIADEKEPWLRSDSMNDQLAGLRFDLCVGIPRKECACVAPD